MNREQYERVQQLFHEALELDAEERSAFLEELAEEDEALRDEVDSLLRSHEEEGLLGQLENGDHEAREQFERLANALSDRYQVESEAGRGGMATVYRARDLKHHRAVAIKVLHPFLAHSLGVDRFLAEIETTAGLQHPHILPLFDSGQADGLLFYVMPFVEGESLSARLERERQLPIEDAVQIAARMAGALDYAHRRNVIHRDIKPGNVLLQDGQPAIADFGIALAVGAARTNRLTQAGHSLGTPRYMSPEQVTGDAAVGPASDQYALACVLHEMLVGEPPFTGGTSESVLRKIVRGLEVAPREVRKSIPPHVDGALRKALERLPADRFKNAKEFAQALTDPSFRYGDDLETAASLGRWRRLALALGVLLLAVGSVATWSLVREEPPGPVQRFNVTPPADAAMIDPYIGVGVALSPGGDQLVYVGVGDEGQQLWHRRFDELAPEPIAWTEGADNPVFSPDGSMVAFKEGDNLKTVSLRGGLPTVLLSEGITGRYMDWGPDNFIYFASDSTISRIPASGGEVERVTDKFPGARTRLPRALPEAAGLLVTLRRDAAAQATVGVVGPNGGPVRELLPGLSARYAASGHLVYGTADGMLMAAPFDLDRLEVTGESVVLVDGLDVRVPGLGAQFTVAEGGTLAYRTAALTDLHQPVWVDRAGNTSPIDPDWSFHADVDDSSLALSPNGDRLLVAQPRGVGGGWDLWMKDLAVGALSRFTTDGIENRRPSWSGDGREVTYVQNGGATPEVRKKLADGAGAGSTLVLGGSAAAGEASQPSEAFFSTSGEWLVVRTGSTDNRSNPDIYAMRIGVDSVPRPLLIEGHVEWAPALSPDGRWLAYASDESGRREVYVRPFPDVTSEQYRVSSAGGDNPMWSRSGGELFYRDGADQLVAVPVSPGATFTAGDPVSLFFAGGFLRGEGHPMYDVTPDGQRFVMLERSPSQGPAELVLVRNWFEELKQRVP